MRANTIGMRFVAGCVAAVGFGGSEAIGEQNMPGGIITFGGGVALYQTGQVIGGLGVSGDTSCADHAISYRMRHLAALDATPNSDNIMYAPMGTTPTGF